MQDFLCTSFFDILFFTIFPSSLLSFRYIILFSVFLGIIIFDITVTLQDFPDTLLFYICNTWCSTYFFPILFFYILLHRLFQNLFIIVSPFYCLSCFSGFSWYCFFWRFKSLCRFEDNRSFFNKHFMALLALTVQWTFINCNWKYRVIG